MLNAVLPYLIIYVQLFFAKKFEKEMDYEALGKYTAFTEKMQAKYSYRNMLLKKLEGIISESQSELSDGLRAFSFEEAQPLINEATAVEEEIRQLIFDINRAAKSCGKKLTQLFNN